MNTITRAIQHLSRSIKRLTRQLRRRHNTVDAKITLSLPLLVKVEIGLKSEPPKAANDNRRDQPGRTA